MKTRKQAVKELRSANKESKSFFGVCKIIKSFWINGYDDAFRYFGLDFADFQPKKCTDILNSLQRDDEGNVFIWRRQYIKHNGESLLDLDGKRIYIYIQKPVTTWTPSTLWTICEQTKEGITQPSYNFGAKREVTKGIGFANIALESIQEEIEYVEIEK